MALELGVINDRVGNGHGAVFGDGVRELDTPSDQVVSDLGACAVLVWGISCVAWAYRADAAVTWDWNRDSLAVDDEISGVVVALLVKACEEPQFAADVFLAVDKVSQGAGDNGPGPRKVDTSGVSYAAWVSVADVSASKVSGARRLHQECRLRV
ncbi:hypothetical protein FQK23_12450, partial [Corynebacterium aurimucosum]